MKSRPGKKVLIFAAALLTVLVFIKYFESFLDKKIDEMYRVSEYTKILNQPTDDFTKDKGQLILERSADNGNVILMGSSELQSWVGQNPINMFPNTTLEENITVVGQAYVQSLLHSMKAGTKALSDEKRVGIVISLQWFLGDDIDVKGFAANFSEYQFYELMKNERISKESRLYVCTRTKELLRDIQGYDDIKVYVWLYAKDSALTDAGLTLLKPYYIVREKVLEIKDKWDTYQLLRKDAQEAAEPKVLDIDWKEAEKAAEEEGTAYCTNNEYYVENSYFTNNLADIIDDLKGVESGTQLQSKEYEDFKMFLQICKENGVEPYIIMMNTNGKYYDYVGIDAERRNEFYDRIEQAAKDQGVDYLRLSEKEYEPYFMLDVMHLGWKGWLYVDQQIAEHYAEIEDK